MTSTDRPTTVEQYAVQNLTRQILAAADRVADRVTDLADTIRRYADDVARVDGSPGHPSYATVVGRIVNETNTTLMNLSLGSLTTTAATADIARAKGQ